MFSEFAFTRAGRVNRDRFRGPNRPREAREQSLLHFGLWVAVGWRLQASVVVYVCLTPASGNVSRPQPPFGTLSAHTTPYARLTADTLIPSSSSSVGVLTASHFMPVTTPHVAGARIETRDTETHGGRMRRTGGLRTCLNNWGCHVPPRCMHVRGYVLTSPSSSFFVKHNSPMGEEADRHSGPILGRPCVSPPPHAAVSSQRRRSGRSDLLCLITRSIQRTSVRPDCAHPKAKPNIGMHVQTRWTGPILQVPFA